MKPRVRLLFGLMLIWLAFLSGIYSYFAYYAPPNLSFEIIFVGVFVSITPDQYSDAFGKGSLEIYGKGRLSDANISLSLEAVTDSNSTLTGMQLEAVKLRIHGAIIDQQLTFDGEQIPPIDLPARLDFSLPNVIESPSAVSLSHYWNVSFNAMELRVRIAGKVNLHFASFSWVIPFDYTQSVKLTGSIDLNTCSVFDYSSPCKQGLFVYRRQ